MKNQEKQYTILFDKSELIRNYFYLTKWIYDGNIRTSYEPLRRINGPDELCWFSLEEAQQILKETFGKIKQRKIYNHTRLKNLSKEDLRVSQYAYGRTPFIVKRTKIGKYLDNQ